MNGQNLHDLRAKTPFRAEITKGPWRRIGVVQTVFPSFGQFIFKADEAEEGRTFHASVWTIWPESRCTHG